MRAARGRGETGLRCELGEELPSATYIDGRGHPKLVRYWQMNRLAGVLHPTNEVDTAEWLAVADARKRLSSERDRDLLEALVGQ